MLRFTSAGVVRDPTTLQLRVGRSFPERMSAGAAEPSRGMTDAEILANIHHFTVDRAGPRQQGCDRLVVSAVTVQRLRQLEGVWRQARQAGITHIRAHVTGAVEQAAEGVDELVAVLDTPERGPSLAGADLVLVPARRGRLGVAEDCLRQVLAAGGRALLAWPLRAEEQPADAPAVRALLQRLAADGLVVRVSGGPPCLSGQPPEDCRPVANRWYADADHQRDEALLFHRDLVRWVKVDACRACPLQGRCSGIPSGWVDTPLHAQVRPVVGRIPDATDSSSATMKPQS